MTSVTTVDTYSLRGLAGPVQITPTLHGLLREEGERVRVRCEVELSAVRAGRG